MFFKVLMIFSCFFFSVPSFHSADPKEMFYPGGRVIAFDRAGAWVSCLWKKEKSGFPGGFHRLVHRGYTLYNYMKQHRERQKYPKKVYPPLCWGSPESKAVCLTFDDGPHEGYTLRLLKVLKKEKVKATFFVVGKMVKKHPELLKAIYEEGHEIANHTYNHKNMLYLSREEIALEWQWCNKTVQEILGIDMDCCRPPGGNSDYLVMEEAEKAGLTTILWSDDPGDYAEPGEDAIMDKFRDYLGDGGIILLHDGSEQMLNILPHMIGEMRDQDYRFLTVSEMLRETYRREETDWKEPKQN